MCRNFKTLYLLFASLLMTFKLAIAQAPECQWVNEITGNNIQLVNSCKSDENNNLYSTGLGSSNFNYDCFFNPVNVSFLYPGQTDLILTKTNSIGNLIWANNISYLGPNGSTIFSSGGEIEYDGSGHLYVSDVFGSTATFHGSNFQDSSISTLSGIGNSSILLAKYDTSGIPVWVRQLDGLGVRTIYNTSISPNGNVAICGSFLNSFILTDSTYVTQGANDGFVAEFSSTGNLLSFHVFGTPEEDFCTDVSYDSNGNLYASICSSGQSIDADPGSSIYDLVKTATNASYFAVIVKLNSSGNLIWAKKLDSQTGYIVNSIQVDDSDDLLIAGQFDGSLDVDMNEASFYTITCNTPNVSVNHFVSKNNSNGDFIWVAHVPTNTFGFVNGSWNLESDQSNNIYISGLSGSCDFNPGAAIDSISAFPTFTSYLWSLDAQGGHRWVKQIVNSPGSPAYFSGITISSDNNTIYCVGYTPSEANFSPASPDYTIFSNGTGSTCGYMAKYGNCPLVIEKETVTHCDSSYVWNGQEYSESGSYFEFFQTEFGCDSVSRLDLQLSQAVSAELIIQSCDPLVINNQTFNSSGLYNQSLISSVGCDSLLTINFTRINSSSATVDVNTCIPVTINSITYNEGGEYIQTLTNSKGCDSLLTINVNFEAPSATVLTADSSIFAFGSFETIQWINCSNNAPILSADSASYFPSGEGQFAAIITLNGCRDTTNCKTYKPSVFTCDDLIISPNPTTDFVSFKYPVSEYLIQVFASNGALIRSQLGNTSTQIIDFSAFAAGVYVLQIDSCRKKVVRGK